jgi:methionine biosynthesis protein MetW
MDPKTFYESLWRTKTQPAPASVARRDTLHRWVLDPIFDPASNQRHDVVLGMLPRGKRLLDIGCWNGDFLSRIRDAQIFSELWGVDLITASVQAAQVKGFQAEVVDLNSEPLPFVDGHFDAVTILAVIEHVFDPYAMISEIHRVLRPGGSLAIAVPNVGSFSNRMRIFWGRIPVTSPDPGWDGGHLHYFTRHDLDRFLRSAGFEILQRKTTGGRPRLREWWISLLAGEMVYLCRRR